MTNTSMPPDRFSDKPTAGNGGGWSEPSSPPPRPTTNPPPVGSAPQTGWRPDKPKALALWTIIATGAVALVTLISALLAPSQLEATKRALEEGSTQLSASDALGTLSFVLLLASYALLAIWMMTIRKNLRSQGIEPGGPPAVEWWGWFVPLANYVLPFLGMRAIARRHTSLGLQLGWWIPFALYWLSAIPAIFISFTIVDFTTGEVTNADALDATVPLGYASAALLLISWGFLATLINQVTDRHLENA